MKAPGRYILIALALLNNLQSCSCIGYGDMTVSELWFFFGCDDIFNGNPRPIHKLAEWMGLRDAYLFVVGMARSSITVSSGNGFNVKVVAKQADEKGRGVFAAEPIKKGQLVWSTKMTARFDSGEEYRRFLETIRDDLACDVLQWAYVQALEVEGSDTEKAFVSVDLDEGSFINSNDDLSEENDGEAEGIQPNIGCDQEAAKHYAGGCKQNYFALLDIEKDQELVLDYGDFAISDGWEWFGL